jgi:glutamate-1-semialdehyde 2,1-aminomutase
MDFPPTTFALYAAGAAALATATVKLKTRLELSKAKHRSLTGHARIARRLASIVPYYEYEGARFFRSDNPPEDVAARREAGTCGRT